MTAPCPESCRCDIRLCVATEGDHCAEINCAICLWGCPAGDDCANPAHWVTPPASTERKELA